MEDDIDNSRILVIPDLHFPYCHPDSLDFLSYIKKTYKPTRVICLGDELDYHALSFHDSDADLDSAGAELKKSIGYIETLGKIFPKMDLIESNHGSMVYRKAKHHGMPRHLLKSYKEVLNAPDSWKWHDKLDVKLPNKNLCRFIHGASSNVLQASQRLAMSLVQGHYHTQFELRYWSNGYHLNFAITSACLIDDKSLAFAYNKLSGLRPIIGVVAITESIPELLPMPLDKNNRWKK
jgi:hypothetical protein